MREPSPPPATGASGVCTRYHCASSTPPGAQRTQSHIATSQSTGQLVDAATTHGAPLLSATTVARQADGHPHHLLQMWTPSTSHPVAHPPVAGALPPNTSGPRYPGTTPVATHAPRTGSREGHGHSGMGPSAAAEQRFHRGARDTKHPPITFPVRAKHRSATPEAPAYPVKHRCSQVRDWQTVGWTTFQPQKAYLLEYVYRYLT